MIQNLIFGILVLKVLFWSYNFFHIRPHVPVDIIFFSSRKFQNQQQLAKKITHFRIQFRWENLTHFTNLNIENNMLPQHRKNLSAFKILHQICFCLVSEKTFALHHFLTPENSILQVLWKQMSVYFCISP